VTSPSYSHAGDLITSLVLPSRMQPLLPLAGRLPSPSHIVWMLLAFAYSLIWLVWQLRPILQNVICHGRHLMTEPSPLNSELPSNATHPHRRMASQVFSLWRVEWFEVFPPPSGELKHPESWGPPLSPWSCAMFRVVWICLVASGSEGSGVEWSGVDGSLAKSSGAKVFPTHSPELTWPTTLHFPNRPPFFLFPPPMTAAVAINRKTFDGFSSWYMAFY